MENQFAISDRAAPTLVDDFEDDTSGFAQASRQVPLVREYLAIIVRRRWVIIGITALSLIIGLVVTLMMTPQYTATARIEISRQQQRITNVEGVDQGDRTFDGEFYETQYELLTAQSVAERIVREMRLARKIDFFEAHQIDPENFDFLVQGDQALTREQVLQREELARKLLLNHVEIAPISRSALVDIRYTSSSPVWSANIANEWGKQFVADSIDRRFASTDDARNFLERRLAELRQDVEASERRLVTYANENDIVVLNSVEQDGKTVSAPTLAAKNLEAMNSALLEATARRVELESQARVPGGSQIASNTAVATLRNRRSDLAARYAEMMVNFEPGYPAARALQEQISEIDAAIAREEARLNAGAQADYRAALAREGSLQARVDNLTDQLRGQERARIQYNIYQNEVDTNRQLYEGVLQRYREIGVASVGANNIAIVDEANVPQEPASPKLPLNIAIALLAGVAIAGVAVFILEQFDEGIREPSDITPLTGLPLLGAIPAAEEDEDVSSLLLDAKTDISEAYLTVRSNLAFSTPSGVPRSVMVTSTRPAEGKSTTSFALACVLARTGKRVLLLDADMRSPSVHKFFGAENIVGFSSYLAGSDDLNQMISETDVNNVHLLTAGRTPPSAAELLSTDRPKQMVEKLLEAFDHVIVDSPPLLGLADAPLLSQAVDGVVFVVESRGVPARAINLSVGRLRDSHARLLGAVVTKLPLDGNAAYGYGYGYGLKYGTEEFATS